MMLEPAHPLASETPAGYTAKRWLPSVCRRAAWLCCAVAGWLAGALTAPGAVQVDFAHSYTGATQPLQNTGDITLRFTVDGAGNVTLDASCALAGPAAYVDEFDGPVGSVSDAAMRGRTFTIVLSSSGSGGLRVSNAGTGLSVQGGNAERLDSLNEQITATVEAAGGGFKLLGLGHANASTSAGTRMNVSGTARDLTAAAGTVDVSTQTIGSSFTIDSAADTDAQGFVLSGLSFDLVVPLTAADAVVGFSNSGTGFGPTPPFVLAGNSSTSITLAFSINSAGVISLDASTTSANAAFAAMVAEWDRANVGSVADASLLGKSFTLTGTGSGGSGNLAISELGGGGIGIQGENSNRIDGLNYGAGDATSTPETLTWKLSAPAGLELWFKGWSCIEGAGGDIRVSNGTVNSDFPNLASATATLALPELRLVDGAALTFREIPGIGATTGAGVSGFTFAVRAPAAPPAGPPGFDNGAGDRSWTVAANWNPDGVPVAPVDAIIDGHDVILSSAVAEGPDELLIADGSLTLTGGGALKARAMTLGRDLTGSARLVMNGAGVSFVSSGSTAADEFAVGSAGTIETKPDVGGAAALELGVAKLVLDAGSEWILDGSNHAGEFTIGKRFVLANFGSFSGGTAGLRTRNFNLPPDRRLELVVSPTSLHYEVKAGTAATGPNIILINVDDMAGGQHFGFDGRDCLTPTLDSLASSGLNFTAAFSASTVCGPSRYSLLTSRWASRNTSPNFNALYPPGTLGRFGVSDTELEHDGQNIGAWLKQAGYRTGFVGKSHVLDDELKDTSKWASKGLITYAKTADPATDATVNAAMRHNHRVVCQLMKEHGFDYVDGFYHANLKELHNDKLNVHNQEWITSRALRFIEENRGERFFLYMAPTINHGPVNNNLDYTLRADPRYTSAGYLPGEDYSFMPSRQSIINQVTAAGKDLISARETWLDHSIRAIIDQLTRFGIRNDTLIIFTSDHGEKTLSGPLVWGKTSLYDLGMKVPLVMNWPNGIASPGRVYKEVVSHVDIPSTLLALTGAGGLPTRPVDGVNLTPVLNGGTAAVRPDVFCEIGYARAVRTKERKYIAVRYTPDVYSKIAAGYRWPEYNVNSQLTGGTIPRPYYLNNSGLGAGVASTKPNYFDDDQLYDLINDPGENRNLYGLDPEAAHDLKKRLAGYLGSIPDRPFRQFTDSSTEFSPVPSAPPGAPQALRMEFVGTGNIRLNWSDTADGELGYVVRRIVNGGAPVIVGELPAGSTSVTLGLDPGVEDIVFEVSSYNALGETAATPVDLLAPQSWRYRTFGDSDPSLSLPTSGWGNDADGDGVSNLWEYACGTNPRLASSAARPGCRIRSGSDGSYLEYRLPRDRRRGLNFLGSVSADPFTGWLTGPPHCIIAEDVESHLLFRSTTPVDGLSRQFIRAEIIDPPGDQP